MTAIKIVLLIKKILGKKKEQIIFIHKKEGRLNKGKSKSLKNIFVNLLILIGLIILQIFFYMKQDN